MGKKLPRRLQRFNRQGTEPTEEAMKGLDENRFSYNPEEREKRTPEKKVLGKEALGKEIATELAMEEVQRFKDKHKRLPEKKEYESISESIYAQLKDKEKRKKAVERLERKRGKRTGEKGTEENKKDTMKKHGRHNRGKEQEEEKGFGKDETETSLDTSLKSEESLEPEGSLSDEEIKGMSVEDLFSSDKKGKESVEFGELEKIDGGEFSLEGLEGMEEKPSASEKCPKCHAETKTVIFCPECGTAFCEKCAKKVEVQGNVKTFVCPDCGKKIKK